ncbi:MAG: hypothetical protein IIA54_04845 [Chloroflexi bacterium]|nr:hypothetical protein [Chloroflexota bacterium]
MAAGDFKTGAGPEDRAPAIEHLVRETDAGRPWGDALVEAVGMWTAPCETIDGIELTYLIGGEAFDWLALAERLCSELDGVIPGDEKEQLLFSGKFPVAVEPEEFKDLLGANKYRAYLNYWYGVVVEEALQLSVEEQVRKRHLALCYADSEDLVEEAFVHLYNANRTDALEEFRREKHIPLRRDLSLSDLKEFTYWLHKRRLKIWDPARVASDTKRGIRRLEALEEAVNVHRVTPKQGHQPRDM